MEDQTTAQVKTKRRENPEYLEIKTHKTAYKDSMKRLFNGRPDWQKLSRAMGILNVPTLIDDRLRLQAVLKKKFAS